MQDEYSTYEIQLAHEIAATLQDRDSIALHLKYVRKHREEYLRRVLNRVMSLPEEKIKRSRAALYTYLVSRGDQYGSAGH